MGIPVGPPRLVTGEFVGPMIIVLGINCSVAVSEPVARIVSAPVVGKVGAVVWIG